MERNGDWLLSLLTKPESDDDVIEMFEYFKLKRLNPKKVFAGMEDIYIDSENIKLKFNIAGATKEQYKNIYTNNLWLNTIIFYEGAKIKLPFGLSFGDNYETCLKKIREHTEPTLRLKDDEGEILIIELNNIELRIYLDYKSVTNKVLSEVLIRVSDIKSKDEFYKNTKDSIAPIDEY